MTTPRLLDEIREVNLSYLIVAQRLLRENRPEAMFRLGIDETAADLIENLNAQQIMKLAAINMLICQIRFHDPMTWRVLLAHANELASGTASAFHAAILMAADPAEVT